MNRPASGEDQNPLKVEGTFGLAWEVAGRYLLIVLGLLLTGHLMLGVLARIETASATENRLRTLVEQAGDRIEAALSLGISLEDVGEAQAGVERLIAAESAITALDVFDANGVFTASTDRASIGRAAPDTWVQAARAGARSLSTEGSRVVIVPLEGAFGDVTGYIVAGYSVPAELGADWARFGIALAIVATILVAAVIFEVARYRAPVRATLQAMGGMGDVDHVPDNARTAMEHLAKSGGLVAEAMRSLERR